MFQFRGSQGIWGARAFSERVIRCLRASAPRCARELAVQAQCGLRLDRWLEVTLKLSLDYWNVELVGFEVFRYF